VHRKRRRRVGAVHEEIGRADAGVDDRRLRQASAAPASERRLCDA
jgi:hypothetical protein